MSRRGLPSQSTSSAPTRAISTSLPTGCRNMPGDRLGYWWQSRGEGFCCHSFRHPRPCGEGLQRPAPQPPDQRENRASGRSSRTSLCWSWTSPRMTTERAGCAKNGDKVQPHPQQFQSLSQKSPASFPRLPHRCQTSATPAAGWIADGAVQAGGRPPGLVVTCGGNREEAEAGVLRWQPCHRLRGPGQASHRTCPRLRSPSSDGISVGTAGRACGGLWGLWPGIRAGRVRRLVLLASSGLERQGNGNRLSDADIIRRHSGRARVAPPRCMTSMHHPNQFPKAKPACGPPD